MRIIVTEKGEDELFKGYETKNSLLSPSRNEPNYRINTNSLGSTVKSSFHSTIRKTIASSLMKPSLHEISVRQKRINIPKNFADKYLKNHMKAGTYLPSLPNQIIDKTKSFHSIEQTTERLSRETYTLRDIITDETFQSINKTIIKNAS